MTNLAWSIFAGILCGIIASRLTLNPQEALLADRHRAGALIIAIASLLDTASPTPSPVREQLMFSQFLLGFGSAFFWPPAMLAGISGVFAGPAQPGQLLGAVRHEPEHWRAARLGDPRHLPDLA